MTKSVFVCVRARGKRDSEHVHMSVYVRTCERAHTAIIATLTLNDAITVATEGGHLVRALSKVMAPAHHKYLRGFLGSSRERHGAHGVLHETLPLEAALWGIV